MSSFRLHYVPEETEALREWHSGIAESFVTELGIKEGSFVLDFGCGAGNYVLPAAKIVTATGKVFAIDKEQIVIDEINERAEQYDLTAQIEAIKTGGSFSLPLEDETMDFVLVFDVIGAIANKQGLEGVEHLVKEFNRLLKPSGKLILALKHINNWRIPKPLVMKTILNHFILEKEVTMTHLHWDFLEEGIITFMLKKE